MGIVRTLARVLVGFAFACLVAALVQVLYVSTPIELAAVPAADAATRASGTLVLALKTATHFAIFAVAFVLIAAGLAEWLSLRSPGYWLMIGAGIGLLGFLAQVSSEVPGQPTILNNYALQSFLTAGFFGGLTYWLIAGARAGASRRRMFIDTATPRIVAAPGAGPIKKGSLAERLAWKRQKDAATDKEAITASAMAVSPKGSAPEASAAPPAQDKPAAAAQATGATPAASKAPSKAASSVPIVRAAEQVAKPAPAPRTGTPEPKVPEPKVNVVAESAAPPSAKPPSTQPDTGPPKPGGTAAKA